MSSLPRSPDLFAFNMPTTWYRPLPVVTDEQPPSPPPPFVLPASIVADEYVAPYLSQPMDAVGSQQLGKRSLDVMQSHGSWLSAITSSSLRSRRDSASSASSGSSSSTCTSISSASTEKRYKPTLANTNALPYLPPPISHLASAPILPPIICRASEGIQRPTLPPLRSVLYNDDLHLHNSSDEAISAWQKSVSTSKPRHLSAQAKRVLCKWFLLACCDPRRDPYPTAFELTFLAQTTELASHQIKNWLTKTRKIVGWSRDTGLVHYPKVALCMAAELEVDLPDNFTLPTSIPPEQSVIKKKLTLEERMELYEKGGLPFRGAGLK